MRAQLKRLAQVADMPNVDLRVMPLAREIALGADSFVIIRFGSRSAAETASLGDIVSTKKPWSKLRYLSRFT
jgi:hypothetical protein